MKIRITDYVFDASAKTVTSSSFDGLEGILLITNVTDNVIIYNFADPLRGWVLVGTTLTLVYDTSTMSDSDSLQIFYDDGVSISTSSKQDTQTTLLQGIAGFTVTGYDYIALTYVAAGNGAGEIETAIFKSGGVDGTTIATLTLTYNASNEIATVTKT